MGRPKKEPTSILNFRVSESDKKKLNVKYSNLTQLFKEWVKELLK